MTKAEQLYCGKAGEAYWERNHKRLEDEALARTNAIRCLVSHPFNKQRWVEVGCGQGHNMAAYDVGIDIDPRQLAYHGPFMTGIIAPAYNIPLPSQSYPVVFSVGCLMHLPSSPSLAYRASWQGAAQEMARISTNYVIIGEYWSEEEKEIEWRGEKGVLWARTYTVPGFKLDKIVPSLPPFDKNLTFGIFKKA